MRVLSLLLLSFQLTKTVASNVGERKLTTTSIRRELNKPCRLMRRSDDEDGAPNLYCELDPQDVDGVVGIIYPIEGYDDDDVTSPIDGTLLFFVAGYYVEDNTIYCPSGVKPIYDTASFLASASAQPSFVEFASQTGEQTVLMIRVVFADAAPTLSVSELSDEVFGTGGDTFTMKSQFAACSYNSFTIEPFAGTLPSQQNIQISNGVHEITLGSNAIGMKSRELEFLITAQLNADLGASWQSTSGIELVMYCLPPGVEVFTAYAYIPGSLSVYSDDWCRSPTGNMHEIGHSKRGKLTNVFIFYSIRIWVYGIPAMATTNMETDQV
eukprot:scaffold128579_cov67-Attheya_sp.AAC.1